MTYAVDWALKVSYLSSSCSFRWPWSWRKVRVGRQRQTFSIENISTTKQASAIKLATNGKTFITWPWLWKRIYGLTSLLFLSFFLFFFLSHAARLVFCVGWAVDGNARLLIKFEAEWDVWDFTDTTTCLHLELRDRINWQSRDHDRSSFGFVYLPVCMA